MSEIPAGWYPDPYETPNLYRWWDGVQWTGDTAPMSAGPAQPQDEMRGAPGWEPRAEPPPWDTQNGPPGLESAPQAWAPQAVPGQWSQPQQAEWHPQQDAGQWSQPDADWGQQPAGAGWDAPPQTDPGPGGPGSLRQPPEPPKKSRGLLIGGIAGGLALVLILGAVVGVVLVRRGHQQAADSPSPTASRSSNPASTAPSSTQPASPAPTGPRISAGPISYVQLPAPWEPNDQQRLDEFDTKKGQYRYTQRNPPGVEGGWIANVNIGSLSSDQFNYGGPDDLQSTANGLASSVEEHYYKPWKTRRKNLEQKKITVSGKPGYEIKFHLDFLNTPKGFAAKGETVLVAVIDSSTGGQGVYVSIPDNAKKLDQTFDLVMNSLQVDE